MSQHSILYETHSHTPLCKHAVGLPQEYAEVAWQRGLRGIVITCHNPMPDGFSAHVRMDENEMSTYVELVQTARDLWKGRVDVRMGLECDYFPGYEDWLARQVKSADFHYILGSVHPQTAEFRQRFWNGNPLEYQLSYFEQLAVAAELQLFDCLSHPDLIKNENPPAWQPAAIHDDVCRILDRIAATGIAMELNTSGVNKKIAEMNPNPTMLHEMRAREIPLVIGADAHEPGRVGDGFQAALDLAAECGYSTVSYFLNRRRHDVPVDEARGSLSTGA